MFKIIIIIFFKGYTALTLILVVYIIIIIIILFLEGYITITLFREENVIAI